MKTLKVDCDKAVPAPDQLSADSVKLWHEVVPRCGRSAGRLAMIAEALKARDRANEAREAIAEHGLLAVTETTGAIHVNPLLRVERENRQLFARLWDKLRLSWDQRQEGGF